MRMCKADAVTSIDGLTVGVENHLQIFIVSCTPQI